MRSALGVVVLFLIAPSIALADELDALMASFKHLPGLEAGFTETKHIDVLDVPLKSEGVIRFLPPTTLSRETTKPVHSRMLIAGGRLYSDDGKRVAQIDVGSHPAIRAFVNSFVLLLAGDRAGLSQIFELRFTPGPKDSAWRLILVPKDSSVAKIITRMEIEGHGVRLERLVVLEASGDRSDTVFEHVDLERRFDERDQKRFFDTGK